MVAQALNGRFYRYVPLKNTGLKLLYCTVSPCNDPGFPGLTLFPRGEGLRVATPSLADLHLLPDDTNRLEAKGQRSLSNLPVPYAPHSDFLYLGGEHRIVQSVAPYYMLSLRMFGRTPQIETVPSIVP